MFLAMFVSLLLVISCAPASHFGVKDQAIGVPPQFGETEAAVAQAERSPGAKYCPEKIAKAKELGKQGVETYWACRTEEAMKLLAEARKLAKEAEGCQPPPSPAATHRHHLRHHRHHHHRHHRHLRHHLRRHHRHHRHHHRHPNQHRCSIQSISILIRQTSLLQRPRHWIEMGGS